MPPQLQVASDVDPVIAKAALCLVAGRHDLEPHEKRLAGALFAQIEPGVRTHRTRSQ